MIHNLKKALASNIISNDVYKAIFQNSDFVRYIRYYDSYLSSFLTFGKTLFQASVIAVNRGNDKTENMAPFTVFVLLGFIHAVLGAGK